MGYTSSDHRNTLTAGVAIQRGHLSDLAGDIHYAHNPSVGNSYETIWGGSTLYVYPATALPLHCTSSAGAADAGVKVYLDGLDANYGKIYEVVTLNAAGVGISTQSFLRINHSGIAGTQNPTGNITITNDSITIANIILDDNTSLKSVFTVPAGYNAYVMSAFISIDKNNDLTARLRYRHYGEVWETAGMVSVFGGSFAKEFVIPPMLPPRTDFEIQAKAGATTGVSAGFELLLERI